MAAPAAGEPTPERRRRWSLLSRSSRRLAGQDTGTALAGSPTSATCARSRSRSSGSRADRRPRRAGVPESRLGQPRRSAAASAAASPGGTSSPAGAASAADRLAAARRRRSRPPGSRAPAPRSRPSRRSPGADAETSRSASSGRASSSAPGQRPGERRPGRRSRPSASAAAGDERRVEVERADARAGASRGRPACASASTRTSCPLSGVTAPTQSSCPPAAEPERERRRVDARRGDVHPVRVAGRGASSTQCRVQWLVVDARRRARRAARRALGRASPSGMCRSTTSAQPVGLAPTSASGAATDQAVDQHDRPSGRLGEQPAEIASARPTRCSRTSTQPRGAPRRPAGRRRCRRWAAPGRRCPGHDEVDGRSQRRS